ncbi:GIY-YIG nuclease family protein [Pseudorhodoplanes sp.]|uniref:GIY-YIG nuclease family protein n=1 Tax=Pseudorhodoplanes sp. TaxID=1934341 RepID=UPI002BE74EC4|nr:GIY-YIG nuclease family protein [Pseudorhodoplanes sp.]HWV52074.1 GIY-YIG nuclease family protein [Pseudorhodoplanes sp.]
MILALDWSRPIPLKDASKQNLIYSVALDKMPIASGVYVFGRRYGSKFEALYVGKANRIRGRVKGQLNNVRLMQHLKNAKSGKRVVLAARFVPKPGQQKPNCLKLIERALIRYFLSEGHDLVNIQGVRLRRHEIISAGKHPKRYFPSPIFLEK